MTLATSAAPAGARSWATLARTEGTIAELAGALGLSPGTTRNHLSAIMRKLDAGSRIEAIRTAEEQGWI
ncbi:MAG: two component transcriptional regulator, LuxR family [Conexibacter sp.]|nr:two component transcriptional regulator, LuxR family [Conexibacter sp.]